MPRRGNTSPRLPLHRNTAFGIACTAHAQTKQFTARDRLASLERTRLSAYLHLSPSFLLLFGGAPFLSSARVTFAQSLAGEIGMMSTGGYQGPTADFTPTGFGSDSPETGSRNGGSSSVVNPPLFAADYKR